MAHILVVDDEDSILIYLTMALEDHGHRVTAAHDAEEAEQLLERELPDLITLDIMMPKRSGITFYCELRRNERYKKVPVVFVSGFTQICQVGSEQSFRRLVPDRTIPRPEACVEKPVELPAFLGLIDRLAGPPELEARQRGGVA
jgi:CheY-like chemotaxis protein